MVTKLGSLVGVQYIGLSFEGKARSWPHWVHPGGRAVTSKSRAQLLMSSSFNSQVTLQHHKCKTPCAQDRSIGHEKSEYWNLGTDQWHLPPYYFLKHRAHLLLPDRTEHQIPNVKYAEHPQLDIPGQTDCHAISSAWQMLSDRVTQETWA